MDKLNALLLKSINNTLINCVLSGKRNKLGDTDKIKIRQVIIKNCTLCQISKYTNNKVIHENMDFENTINFIKTNLLTNFKQAQIQCETHTASVLVSSKGKFTIKEKAASLILNTDALNHNRTKSYLLPEGTFVPFLYDLNVMDEKGNINKSKYDKFKQINRFLEFIRDIVPSLNKSKRITILDFGCGKSYLTFAMYYYLTEVEKLDIQIIGLDLKKDVISHCNRLAQNYGYENLHFLCGDVADYDKSDKVDMVVTLHACDTATDYALAKAVMWDADVIMSVPCCQHEFNKTINCDLLSPIFNYGIVKEKMAALLTDGIRANLLERCGYETNILEFIDTIHTPKNLLIRATKSNKRLSDDKFNDCKNLIESLHVSSTLYNILDEGGCLK